MAPDKPRVWIPALAFLLAAIAVGTGGFLLFKQHALDTERTAHDQLGAVADLKVGQIGQWLNDQRGHAEVISRDNLLAEDVEHWFQESAPAGARERKLLARLASLSRVNQYKGMVLVDQTGHPRLGVGEIQNLSSHDTNLLLQAMRENVVRRSDIHWSSNQEPEMDMVAPLSVPGSQGPRVIGAVYFHIDPNVFFFPYVQSWPTMSPSGETLLVRRDGNKVLFLNELRHRKGAVLKLRLPIDQSSLPAAMALQGQAAVAAGVDYRGVPVLFAARKVPDTPWILMAKVDRAEVEAPLRRLAETASGLAVLFVVLVGLVATLWWRMQHAQVLASLADEKLRRQLLEKHFDYSTRFARDMVFLDDASFRVLECNDAALKAYGYSLEELRALKPGALRAPETCSALESDFKGAEGVDGKLFETVHQRKDGSTFPVETSARLIEIEGRRYYHAVVRDITERKAAQQALERELAKHRALMDTAIDGIHIVDTKGRLVDANPAFLRMLGYAKDEAIGLHVPDWDARRSPDKLPARICSLIGTSEIIETLHRRKDGTTYDAEVSISGFKVGTEDYLFAAARDITERKRAEAEIRALNADLETRVAERTRQLENASRAKTEFMANVTHELRTPLNSVIGFAGLLKDEVPGPLNARQAAFAADILASGQHLLALVQGILEMSRLDANEAAFQREPVEIGALLKERMAAHRKAAGARGLTMRLDGAEDVGSAELDPGALRRMVDALLDNAIKFNRDGGTVAASARRANHALEIAVADTGIGIAREDLGKLFKPLVQLDAGLARQHGGVGLGLALARRLAELHGGTIEVDSEPGKGSIFTLHLPTQE